MNRPRKTGAALPWRMYQHGLGYRFHHVDGSKVNLGRDLEQALRRYYSITSKDDPLRPPAKELSPAFMMSRHKKGARQRGIEFDLMATDVTALMDAQGGCCAVTGLRFRVDKVDGMRIRPWLPSIDRIDGSRGYKSDNVRLVCGFVNVALMGFGDKFFSDVLEPLVRIGVQAKLTEDLLRAEGSIPAVGRRGYKVGILDRQVSDYSRDSQDITGGP